MRRFLSLLAIATLAGCAETGVPTSTEMDAAALGKGAAKAKLAGVFNTQLRTENEVPARDSEAKGHAQIKIYDDGTIEWKVKINNKENEEFFMGHIHQAEAGANGGVVLWLVPPSPPVPPTTPADLPNLTDRHLDFRGSAVDPALAAAILADPANYYVNFHTREFPGGAIRGQLE